MPIKNIIFDVGNVLVKWAPFEVIPLFFPDDDPEEFFHKMRPVWIKLNLGQITEEAAIDHYHKELGVSKERLSHLMEALKSHQKPLAGSIALLETLQKRGLHLFSITDNIKEIMVYHRQNSDFPRYFKDIISSADVGFLKPDPRIYQHLIDKHHLIPSESVFFDDLAINIEGARATGLNAFQFSDVRTCEQQLRALGILV